MFEKEYKVFESEILRGRFQEISLLGHEYQFFCSHSTNRYHQKGADEFWHISSIEPKDCSPNSEIHPCVNTSFESSCCVSSSPTSLREALYPRVPCNFRADSIRFIKKALDSLISKEITGLKVWTAPNKQVGRTTIRFYIRKTFEKIDFVTIFDVRKEKRDVSDGHAFIPLVLVTAFPIEYASYRKKFDKQWENGRII
ncbi:MAG: hypothetical protein LKK13_00940 [Bacilli bacterium]|jgi:hypothetical protein|nr:hypothetical protein [Bacilli bacterium]